MLATNGTSTGTWVALVTLVVMMLPVYFMTLRGAQGYGRLEQKVDELQKGQTNTAAANAITNQLIAESISKLTDAFQTHAVQDAGHFGELRGLMGATPTKPA